MFPTTIYYLASTEEIGNTKNFDVIAVDPDRGRLERLKEALEKRNRLLDKVT